MKYCIMEYEDVFYAVGIQKKNASKYITVYKYDPKKWVNKYTDKKVYMELLVLQQAEKQKKNMNPASKNYLLKLAETAVTIYAENKTIGETKNQELKEIESAFPEERRQEHKCQEIIKTQEIEWEKQIQKSQVKKGKK